MTLVVLYLLATVDGAFCGYRSAAGRSALIDKRAYYRRAMMRGALWAQIAAVVAAGALLAAWKLAPERGALIADLRHAALRMLWVFVPYAAVIFGSFAVRALPSTDLRSATSVMIFGPMTALRPFVAFAGVLYGIVPAGRWETKLLGAFVLALMLALEPLLDRIAALQTNFTAAD